MAQPKVAIPADEVAGFCRRHEIRSLAIFGSVLRGDFRAHGDVDVLVESEPRTRVGFIALSQMRRELAGIRQRPADLVPKAGLKPKIREAFLSGAKTMSAAFGVVEPSILPYHSRIRLLVALGRRCPRRTQGGAGLS